MAGQRLAPARDANRAQDAAGSWVVPSADVVALWAAMDAALGEPDDPRGYIQDAAERLDDYDLVELIARLERDASNVRVRQLVAVEVLSRRASMNPYWPVRVAQPCVAGEEVAAALGTSRYAGRELVDTARLLAGPLLATAAALESGDIDWGKAKIVAAVLGDVAVEVALDVQDRVLPGAGARTHAQLRADLAKALIVIDPADAEQRTVRAVDKRRICHPKILPDGMAGIWAVLPGVTAAAIDTALSAAARTTQRTGDPRTTDQLRADTLTHALLGHPSPPASDLGAGAQGAGALGGHANGRSRTGSGPSAATCPAGGFPPGAGFPVGAAFGLPWGNPSVPTGPAPIVPSAPTTMTSPTGAGLGLAGGVRVDVTVSLATLLGLDESPAQLIGYGPITAQTARRLATTGTWRRLVTDPVTGTVLDVGKTRYRPPDDLARIIRARDTPCLSPICTMPAARCDLDHREPFHPDGTGGSTSADNLAPLCERDHLIKTHAHWKLHLDLHTPGSYRWTTPTGHTYTYRPEPPPGHEPPLDWDPPPPF